MYRHKPCPSIVMLGALLLACALPAATSLAAPVERHPLPIPGTDLVGEDRSVKVREGQTLLDVAREQGIGQEEILNANPDIDRWLPKPGEAVMIPGQRLLPEEKREGIVINLPELRLYYFPSPPKTGRRSLPAQKNGVREVITFPVAVGRMDWKTPLGLTKVASKQKNPSWTPPASIRAEHAAEGDPLPRVVRPGPDNPLGAYALRLGVEGYLIHGTDKEFGVGMRVTHGCMRLLPEHIEALFHQVPIGTPVRIVDRPIKLGWGAGELYLEAHPPLEEDGRAIEDLVEQTLDQARAKLANRPDLELDEEVVGMILLAQAGLPILISRAKEEKPSSTNLF
jgi:L,D-transpeptidase ErfK/SrfK